MFLITIFVFLMMLRVLKMFYEPHVGLELFRAVDTLEIIEMNFSVLSHLLLIREANQALGTLKLKVCDVELLVGLQ